MLNEMRERVQKLEEAVLAARGLQVRAEEDAADAKAGTFQTEGRLVEARDGLTLAEEAGLEASIEGLTGQVTDLRGRLTPKALEAYDEGDRDE